MANIHQLADSFLALLAELRKGNADREGMIERFESIANAAEEDGTVIGKVLEEASRANVALLQFGGSTDLGVSSDEASGARNR